MKPILTIIPTTGAPELRQAVESALPNGSDVLLVTDSDEGFMRVAKMLNVGIHDDRMADVFTLHLPFRVGGGEWAGHRIYAAVPHLVNHEFVAFLDEDNWYEPDHLPAMVKALEHADVAWSYRNIVQRDGTFVCRDECESLGPGVIGIGGRRLVDTSCWAFRTEWLRRKYCAVWDGGWGQDARFTSVVHAVEGRDAFGKVTRIAGTGLYSVNYRLGASERSPKAEFFLEGNRRMASLRETVKTPLDMSGTPERVPTPSGLKLRLKSQ